MMPDSELECGKTGKSLEGMGFEQLKECVECEEGCDAMRKLMDIPSQRRIGVITGK